MKPIFSIILLLIASHCYSQKNGDTITLATFLSNNTHIASVESKGVYLNIRGYDPSGAYYQRQVFLEKIKSWL